MGLMDKFKQAVGLGPTPAPVEWQGEEVSAHLGRGYQDARAALLGDQRRRNVWAVLRPGRTSSGRPKVDVHALAGVTGREVVGGDKLGQASVHEGGALDGVIREGVQVGVVRISDEGEIEAVLFLGRGYKYRPSAGWD